MIYSLWMSRKKEPRQSWRSPSGLIPISARYFSDLPTFRPFGHLDSSDSFLAQIRCYPFARITAFFTSSSL